MSFRKAVMNGWKIKVLVQMVILHLTGKIWLQGSVGKGCGFLCKLEAFFFKKSYCRKQAESKQQ